MNTEVKRKKRIKRKPLQKVNTSGAPKNHGRAKKKKAVSTIDPRQLVNRAMDIEEKVFVPTRTFDEMPLHHKLKKNLQEKGFAKPTQIQDETLEKLIKGRDLVGIANTGTGKTGAFLIPIIEQLLNTHNPFTSLVILPTRELALQVEEEFISLTKNLNLRSVSLIGGTNINKDLTRLRRRNDLIIGTPGRLMDLANRRVLNFRKISVLVLDEFDRMLDMGFVNDIKKIVSQMESRKQTMLFSATIDQTQKSLIASLLEDPLEVKVSSGVSTADKIDQDVVKIPEGADRFNVLLKLMDDDDFEKVLVFAETKRMVDKVTKKLNKAGIPSELIHGNKSQSQRMRALNNFKAGNSRILVATDVAARGIDVSNVTHVINYQIPLDFNSYIHRIGRTGRAGKRGKALTFID